MIFDTLTYSILTIVLVLTLTVIRLALRTNSKTTFINDDNDRHNKVNNNNC